MTYELFDSNGRLLAIATGYPEALICARALAEAAGPVAMEGSGVDTGPRSRFEWDESIEAARRLVAPAA